MRRAGARPWLAAALAIGTWTSPAAAERAFEVDVQPGWVRVALEESTLAEAMRGARVEGPDGAVLPLRRLAASEAAPRLSVTLVGVERRSEGDFELLFDLGERPPEHERLLLGFVRLTVALGCRLAASDDGASFRPIATGDLYRLGESAGLARGEFAYPATRARYLRLSWPASAGPPELQEVEAVAAVVPRLRLSARSEVQASPSPFGVRSEFGVPGPGYRARELSFELSRPADFGYRLEIAVGGRWQLLAEGERRLAPSQREVTIELPRLELPFSVARLELFASEPLPPPAQAFWQIEPAYLLFEARAAGRHRVVIGTQSTSPTGPLPGAEVKVTEVGMVRPLPARESPLPAAAMRPSEPPPARFARRFALQAHDRIPPGAVAYLRLPPELTAELAEDLGDLRLAVDGRHWPFVRVTEEAPRALAEARLVPVPSGSAGESEVELALPGPRQPWTAVALSAFGPFERQLELMAASDLPGPNAWRSLGWSRWECPPGRLLPCRLEIGLGGRSATALRLRLRDGDNPPLPALAAEVWAQRHRLRFAWPERGEVELLAVSPGLAPARFDVELLGAELAVRERYEVTLLERPAGGALERYGGAAAVAALAIAALVLVGLLWRMLRK